MQMEADLMDVQQIPFLHNHREVLDRFVAACQADPRVAAAFLGGSYARGAADAYSDLDLYLITTDEAYEDFLAGREAFIRLLGEPLFLADFGNPYALFCIFSNGTEGELWIGRESRYHHIYAGAYSVLLDKKGLLANAVFPPHAADPARQLEILRQQVDGFWHELAHFIKAMGRKQLWFAMGQLEVMRQICVNLARLQQDFLDADAGKEPYFKVERALPVEQLTPLQATYPPLEYRAMLLAGRVITRFYQDVAPALAEAHGLTYQADLERMLADQLDELAEIGSS